MNEIKTKLGAILGSVRFWIVTLTAIIAVLEAHAGGGGLTAILDVVKLWLITVAGIGTADSIAERIGVSKLPAVPVIPAELGELLKEAETKLEQE